MKTIIFLILLIIGMYVTVSLFDIPELSAQEELQHRVCSLTGGIPLVTSDYKVVCVQRMEKKNAISSQ